MGGSERAFGDDDVGGFSMIQQAAEVQEGSHDWGEGGDGSEGERGEANQQVRSVMPHNFRVDLRAGSRI
jgi:hypothetical protein